MKTQTSIPTPDGAEFIPPAPPHPCGGRGKQTLLAVGAMIGMSLLFGASFVGTKFGLQSFTTSQLVFLRFAVAAVLFAALTPWAPSQRVDRRQFWRLLGLALLQPVLYFFLEVEGLQRTLASTASVLITTIPLFVMAIEAAGLKTRILAHELLLVLVSLVGLTLLLTAQGLDQALGGSLTGNLLILAAAVTSSFYTVLARRAMAEIDALTVTRLQAYWASLFFLPWALRDWRHAT